jgi:hypothetical protein
MSRNVVMRCVRSGLDVTPAIVVISPGLFEGKLVLCSKLPEYHVIGTWFQGSVKFRRTFDATGTAPVDLVDGPDSLVQINEVEAVQLLTVQLAASGRNGTPMRTRLGALEVSSSDYALNADGDSSQERRARRWGDVLSDLGDDVTESN